MKALLIASAAVLLASGVQALGLPGKVGTYGRFDEEISSPHKLRKAMLDLKAAGVDFIMPNAKGTSGKVNWDSKVAPGDMIGDRGYMEKIVKYAHAAGLKVYPVFCVCTEGGDKAVNPLLRRNPSWASFFEGERRGYIDPGNADARRYEVALISELVSKYDVDGLSLDYMRAPNRIGWTDSGRDYFLRTHKVDLAEVTGQGAAALDTEGGKKAAQTAASPREHPIWPEWRQWRRDKLNTFMREIDSAVEKARPGLPISSYCWGAHTYTGNFETCQDWKTWISEGLLDWINPSGYRYTDEAFREAARLNRAAVPKGVPFYITIGVKTSHGELPTTADIERHMRMSREAGADGIIFFRWESLRAFLPELSGAIRTWASAAPPASQ